MKGNIFTIVFFIIFIMSAGISDADTTELIHTNKMKYRIKDSYMNAVDSAINQLKSSFEHDERLNKEKAVETFFYTMYAGLGILDEPLLKEQLDIYVPVIAVLVNDGFYIQFNEEYENAGRTEIRKIWSELIPFDYEDDFFIYRFTLSDSMTVYDKKNILNEPVSVIPLTYKSLQEKIINSLSMNHIIYDGEHSQLFKDQERFRLFKDKKYFQLFKQEIIISKIERYLTYYINLNNYIAEKYGITYHFYLPVIDQSEWIRSINEASMIVFFQGYPYNNGRNTYNQFVISGASVKRPECYYIVPKEYYYIYHKSECIYLKEIEINKTAYSLLECAEAGAFPCDICN